VGRLSTFETRATNSTQKTVRAEFNPSINQSFDLFISIIYDDK